MLIIKKGERKIMDGIQLPNKDTIKTLGEKESYKYLGILEADIIKQTEMKGKVKKKRIPQENKKTPRNQTQQQKSDQRNQYLIIRYSGPFLK